MRGRPAHLSARNTGLTAPETIPDPSQRFHNDVAIDPGASVHIRRTIYAAIFATAALSELDVIVPLRPFGKKPPCFAPAFPPNAR